jgi:predicted permease
MLRDLLSDVRFRLRALFRRGAVEREMADELDLHIAIETDRLVRQGLLVDEARRQARLALGGVEQVKEATRDARGLAWLDTFVQNLRWTARSLRRSPGFTIAVVLTIALGLGANAALFGVIDRLMFRPPAYLREPSQVNLVYLYWRIAGRYDVPRPQMRRMQFDNIARATRPFDAITGFYDQPQSVGTGADKGDRTVSAVTGNFFTFFVARPVQGRFIDAADESVPTGAPVAVISYSFWRDRFGGRSGIVGTTLQVGSVVRTIVGVAPDGFVGITDGLPADLWIPADSRSGLKMVVRRKHGVKESAASAALTYAFLKSWELERAVQPRMMLPIGVARPRSAAVSLFPMRRPEAGPEAMLIPWLAGVGLIVLMIACANVANLLLARALRRRREIAVRLALGISRSRLLLQLLTESLVLAVLGGVAGLLMARWGAEALRALLMPAGTAATVVTDFRTLLFASCAVLTVGILAGLAPAAHALRQDLVGNLKSGVREGSYQPSRTRSTLLVMQVALSTMLLIGAGLFERSIAHLRTHGLGYDVDPVLTAAISTHGTALNDTAISLLTRRLETEAKAIPGVMEAAHGTTFAGFGEYQPLMASEGEEVNWALFRLHAVGPDYFAALGTRVLRGRAIGANDRRNSPLVAMVSQTSAHTLWPGQNAIGQCLRVGLGTKGITDDRIYIAPDTAPCRTVVGIAEDLKLESFVNDPGLQYYLPSEQWRDGDGDIVLRVSGDAANSAETIRRHLQRLMPGTSEVTVTTMRDGLASQMKPWQLGMTLFMAFGGLALVVAAVGLLAVISYNVEQRSHELGVRIALGAESDDVLRLVVGQAMRFAAVGVAIGGAIAVGAGRWIRPLLFAESPGDPAVYAVVASVLIAVALVASAFPAWRAARTDPNLVLRRE